LARTGRAFPSRYPSAWRTRLLLATFLDATAVITGTATSAITETDIVAGGKTIIITLTADEWVAAGANFDAQRQNIINGLDSAQAEATGWDAKIRDGLVPTDVVRTSATVVTVTLPVSATYNITAQETITVTVPASALLVNLIAVVGTPTFTVDASGAGNAARSMDYHLQGVR
jgi:hypothetical protein